MARLAMDSLDALRRRARQRLSLGEGGARARIVVHMGTCGIAAGAGAVESAFLDELERSNLPGLDFMRTGCAGLCSQEPMATVLRAGEPPTLYGNLTAGKAQTIFQEHVVGGQPVARDVIDPELPFFRKQQSIVLRNKGLIDPERIDDAIARDAYAGLAKVLAEMGPDDVLEEVAASGLRGRGGAGFPTGLKWKACRAVDRFPKYLVANCDEGDPGAYMDRSLLEADPHAVIEGMAIAAYAIGVEQGFVYMRTEYPLAIQRLHNAILQARDYGLLGPGILGTGFNFDLEIREGSGAFVCGEETSLIHSIEGESPEPRQRPPFPVQMGVFGQPTVINNVETFANVPVILAKGAGWFSGIGTATSKGTKIFSLVGKINHSGLIEVPMGITLREIIEEIGGGIPDAKPFKALQTGGPSGGCIPADLIDSPVDYESLNAAGSMMGSGGMIVLDEDTCMVDVAKYFIQFTNDESCGKCSTCREGSDALLDILTRITEGNGVPGDLELLEELGAVIKDASMCGLGTTLPNPVLSTLRHFRKEYEAHIADRACPARACKHLVTYFIDPDRCVGCRLCLEACPSGAILGDTKQIHVIDPSRCSNCGECFHACPPRVAAVRRLTGKETAPPDAPSAPLPVVEWKQRGSGAQVPR